MRLFIGAELADRVKKEAAAVSVLVRQRLREASGLDVRWVPPENLHITLCFLGEVADERGPAIADALDRPTFTVQPFALALRGLGCFPPAGPPRVFWIGVASGVTEMQRIHRELAARLAPLGFEPERRAYAPHVTIARVKHPGGSPRMIRDVLAATPADCGVSDVAAITLFRSRLSPRGASYEPVLRVPLS